MSLIILMPLTLYKKSVPSSAWDVIETEPSSMKVRRMRRYFVMIGPPQAKGAERKICDAPMSK